MSSTLHFLRSDGGKSENQHTDEKKKTLEKREAVCPPLLEFVIRFVARRYII